MSALTREQIPAAQVAIAWLRGLAPCTAESARDEEGLPGYEAWFADQHPQADDRWADALEAAVAAASKPTIPLRIRVGVTADGRWACMGADAETAKRYTYGADPSISDDLDGDPVVAWHWITAEVPMPETEQGETKGEVEP